MSILNVTVKAILNATTAKENAFSIASKVNGMVMLKKVDFFVNADNQIEVKGDLSLDLTGLTLEDTVSKLFDISQDLNETGRHFDDQMSTSPMSEVLKVCAEEIPYSFEVIFDIKNLSPVGEVLINLFINESKAKEHLMVDIEYGEDSVKVCFFPAPTIQ